MAVILYINNEHCTSVAQLKGYFSEDLTSESDIYTDLLDYGRHGEMATWLQEMGEPDMAAKIGSISTDLSDHAFYAQLKATITDAPLKDDPDLKPPFDKCFSFEDLKCDVKYNEANVIVGLRVVMGVNETYELSVSSNWGTRAERVNPASFPEGKTAFFAFSLPKHLGKDVGEITVKADGVVLSQTNGSFSSSKKDGIELSKPSISPDNDSIKDLIKKRELSKILSALLTASQL